MVLLRRLRFGRDHPTLGVLGESVGALMEAGASIKDVRRSYQAYFDHNVPFSSPGFADLLKRFGLE